MILKIYLKDSRGRKVLGLSTEAACTGSSELSGRDLKNRRKSILEGGTMSTMSGETGQWESVELGSVREIIL